jgi:hypothetical protein
MSLARRIPRQKDSRAGTAADAGSNRPGRHPGRFKFRVREAFACSRTGCFDVFQYDFAGRMPLTVTAQFFQAVASNATRETHPAAVGAHHPTIAPWKNQ